MDNTPMVRNSKMERRSKEIRCSVCGSTFFKLRRNEAGEMQMYCILCMEWVEEGEDD